MITRIRSSFRTLLLVTSAVTLLGSSVVWADNYEITVTRSSSNLYKVQGRQLIVKTRYCYEYVYSEQSLLRMNGYGGDIIFIDSGGKCDVEAVYAASEQKAGKYVVTVSHEDDDWYSMLSNNLFIKTSGCLDISLAEEAILTLNGYGGGSLKINGSDCIVDAVYEQLKL